ncbi:MAG: heme o synthase [Planctomycetota bacterium]|nr:heme o synthase [Planctomycetota bacterium]
MSPSSPMRIGSQAVVRGDGLATARAWVALVKPRITLMVVFVAFIGGLLAAGPDADLGLVAAAALCVGLTAAGAGVFNQVIERDLDALMRRTMGRPLVTGRVRVRDAILFGAALTIVGVFGLASEFGLLSALLALATLLAYTLVYTPLKLHSSFNTAVGAIPGAMPPLIGFVALAGEPGPWGWMLFAVLFVWQFPHFLAIAWLYRDDYRRAGMKMLPALPGSDGIAGRQALLYALALLPVSLLPGVRGDAGITYSVGAVVLGLAYVGAAGAFALRETPARARAVLLTSLAYVPLLFSLVLFDPVVRRVLDS